MKIGYLVSFLVGGAIGTSLTLYFSNKHFEKRKAIELEGYKEYYDKKLAKTEKADEICTDHDAESNDADEGTFINPYTGEELKAIAEVNAEIESEEEKEIREAADYLEKIGVAQEEKVSKKRSKKTKKDKPYLITPEAYNGDDDTMYKDDYQHLTLDYYEGDDMVCESSTNEVFANTGRWLGYTWKNHFGDDEYEYGPNEVYIRNDELRCDYEIVRDSGYYSEAVLGIAPEIEEE